MKYESGQSKFITPCMQSMLENQHSQYMSPSINQISHGKGGGGVPGAQTTQNSTLTQGFHSNGAGGPVRQNQAGVPQHQSFKSQQPTKSSKAK